MKYLIILLVFVCSFSAMSKGLPIDYHIIRSAEYKRLKKQKSIFIFTFLNQNKAPIQNEIFYSYNGKEKRQWPDSNGTVILNVKPGKYIFMFTCGPSHYEVITDSIAIAPGFITEIQVNFRSSESPAIMKKPVIYVYPQQTERVSIKLKLKGEFLFTYPEYKNGWSFIADPDGTIHMNDKKYHYLFWDGKINIEKASLNFNEGFVVDKKDLITFFESKLQLMGLNSKEMEDFITYWCPIMQTNEKNFIHFIFNEEYNKYATMSIDPKPDHLFRVNMLWSKAEDMPVKEQKIESFKRSGFTIVEWGGTEIPNLKLTEEL